MPNPDDFGARRSEVREDDEPNFEKKSCPEADPKRGVPERDASGVLSICQPLGSCFSNTKMSSFSIKASSTVLSGLDVSRSFALSWVSLVDVYQLPLFSTLEP